MRRHVAVLLGVAFLSLAARRVVAQGPQSRVLTGTVLDSATQRGVVGTISVVGGPQVTQANDNGQFRITVPASAVTLSVRALGYKERQIVAGAEATTVSITLVRTALELSQVVVTGAATTQEQRNVPTAVTTIDAQTVAAVPTVSLISALQGNVAGASVNMNSGAPGGGGQIQIRGPTTILGNGDPLYVVDGVIISDKAISPGTNAITKASGSNTAQSNQDNAVDRLEDINPDEIESIQVLKSAAASAIYGSQATNGVVIITTKRAQSGTPTFHLSQTVGVNAPLKLLGSRHFEQGSDSAGTGLAYLLGSDALAQQYCPGGSATSACPYYDYQHELYKTRGVAYETNLSMSGGSDVTKYFVSGSDKDNPGTLLNTGARRQELRVNVDQAFGSHWTASVSAGVYRSSDAQGFSGNDNTFTNPFIGLAYTPAVVNLQAQNPNGTYVNNPILPLLFGIGSNPFQLMQGMTSSDNVSRQIAGGTLKYSVFTSQHQHLSIQANGGFDSFGDNGETYAPPYLQSEQTNALPGRSVAVQTTSLQYNGALSAVHVWTPGAIVRQISSATTSFGLQYEERYENSYSVLAQGLIPGLTTINQGSPTLTDTTTDVRNEALYASEEILAFDDNLSLTGRVRAEKSSVNGDQNKFYYWPGGAVAYHLPKFIPDADDIKLRFSIGLSGNQPLYGSRDVLIGSNGVIGGSNALGVPTAVGNPTIRPEQMQEDEFGIDATFFDSRLGFEGSVYQRNITQLLLQAALAPTSGFTTEYINGGDMRTRGIELAVSVLPIRSRVFTWTSKLTWYSDNSFMVSLPVPAFNLANAGFGAGYGQGRVQAGYNTTLIWGNVTNPQTGAVTFAPIADATPKFTMSWANSFQAGRFAFSFLLDWREGGSVLDMTEQNFDEAENSWDYDQPSPNPAVGSTLGAYRYNTWNSGQETGVYIQNGTFVKLREATLTYTLPRQWTNHLLSGHDWHLKATGQNLIMWSKYWAFDPEVSNWGDQPIDRFIDLASYPTSRIVRVGFDVTF
jgi:TonB-dependent starch-binding outer membrane protein SusC